MNILPNHAKVGAASLVLAVALALGAPANLDAQLYAGGQVDAATDTDLGIGGRVLGNVEAMNLEVVGSFDLYFPEGPVDFWELNGNIFYHFHLPENPDVLPYIGGGANVGGLSNGVDETEVGLNVGGGVRFPLTNISPFIEGRAVVSGVQQFVLSIGMLFGHAHGR